MDCFKAAMRSGENGKPSKEPLRSSHQQQQSPAPSVPKRSSSEHRHERNQRQLDFEMPYDPIELDNNALSEDLAQRGRDLALLEEEDQHHDSHRRQRDWWETLFPARFALNDSNSDGDSEAGADPAMSLPGRRENAYRRVWERLQREEAEAAAAATAARRSSSTDASTEADGPATSGARRQRALVSSSRPSSADCLWTSEELRLFRNELAKLHKENHVLKAAVRFQAERLRCLDTKCRAQSRQLETKSSAVGESAKAGDRYRILADSLQQRVNEAERQCADLRSSLAIVVDERDRALAEARDSGQRLQRAGAKLARYKQRQAGLRDDLAREFAVRSEQARADQAAQLRQLEDSLVDLRAELRKERYLHNATRLGHQQLLSHFSSSASPAAAPSSHGNAAVCSACGGDMASEAEIRLF